MTAVAREVRAGITVKEKADEVRAQRAKAARLRVLEVGIQRKAMGGGKNVPQWDATLDTVQRDRIKNIDIIPSTTERNCAEMAAVAFDSYIEEQMDKPFHDGMANLACFHQLIRHNPLFREEIGYLKMMIDGEWFLNQFSQKVSQL
ncbi:MAG: hypothetical protein LLG06_17015 [Desulfobacteraceae bacterium]|nr:hypothetical protein [Desulfobacteraceae bacterium]